MSPLMVIRLHSVCQWEIELSNMSCNQFGFGSNHFDINQFQLFRLRDQSSAKKQKNAFVTAARLTEH